MFSYFCLGYVFYGLDAIMEYLLLKNQIPRQKLRIYSISEVYRPDVKVKISGDYSFGLTSVHGVIGPTIRSPYKGPLIQGYDKAIIGCYFIPLIRPFERIDEAQKGFIPCLM